MRDLVCTSEALIALDEALIGLLGSVERSYPKSVGGLFFGT